MDVQKLSSGKVTLYKGDCRKMLRRLPMNSVHSGVCDPPYHLQSIVKRFGAQGAAPARHGTDGLYARQSRGFMGQVWDGGEIAQDPELWALVWRALKPGGYLLAFGGTRTYHRMVCAIEDAGFDIRDMILWSYGTGFPKSHSVSQDIEKTLCERVEFFNASTGRSETGYVYKDDGMDVRKVAPFRHPEANQWAEYGTALKPAIEPICVAQKPMSEGTVAENVRRWGVGAFNINACRLHAFDALAGRKRHGGGVVGAGTSYELPDSHGEMPAGRWPANLMLTDEQEVTGAFPSGAARFFYQAKASKVDRCFSNHPTVKPITLMRYLCRLVTPPNGLVLDPFAGTGTTGQAAVLEGLRAALIERETEYQGDIVRRLSPAMNTEQALATEAVDNDGSNGLCPRARTRAA